MINASPRMGHRAKNKMITAKEAIQTVRIFKLQLITSKLPGTRQREKQVVATLECKILIYFKNSGYYGSRYFSRIINRANKNLIALNCLK